MFTLKDIYSHLIPLYSNEKKKKHIMGRNEGPLHFILLLFRDSVVGIATSYGLDDRGVGVRVPVGSRIFASPNRPDWL
jgi:hypothetical protein